MRPGVRKCRRLLCPAPPAGILFLRCQISSPRVVNLQPLETPFEVCSLRSFDGGFLPGLRPRASRGFFCEAIEQVFSLSQARDAPFRGAHRYPRARDGQIEGEGPGTTEKSHNAVKHRATRSETLPAGRCELVECGCMRGRCQLHLRYGFPAKSWGWCWAAGCVKLRIPWRYSGAIQSKAYQLQARSMLGCFRLTPTRY
jgi:hypothetical protein